MHRLDGLPAPSRAVKKRAQEQLEARLLAIASATVWTEEDHRRLRHAEVARPEEGEPSRGR